MKRKILEVGISVCLRGLVRIHVVGTEDWHSLVDRLYQNYRFEQQTEMFGHYTEGECFSAEANGQRSFKTFRSFLMSLPSPVCPVPSPRCTVLLLLCLLFVEGCASALLWRALTAFDNK